MVEPLAVAKILKAIVDAEQPGFVITGKQAIDDDANQVGQMLAALLGWAQGTFASKLTIEGDSISVTREVDGGLQTLKLKAPAIISTDLRLNEPRFVKLPEIMKAKTKPLTTIPLTELGITGVARVKTLKTEPPPGRQRGIMVKDANELFAELHKRGLV